jgi:hypothetical protein
MAIFEFRYCNVSDDRLRTNAGEWSMHHRDPRRDLESGNLSRRQFLIVGGAAAATPVLADEFHRLGQASRRIARLRRDRDLLNIEVEFVGFREEKGILIAANDSYVVLHFPPQNLAESVFEEKQGANPGEIAPLIELPNSIENSPISPVRSYVSGPSRVVFVVPKGQKITWKPADPCGCLVDDWLRQLSQWNLRVPRVTQMKGNYSPRPALSDETDLELPYRLHIAPRNENVRLLSSAERMPFDPPSSNDFELWNAQLISRVKLEPAKAPDLSGLNDPNLKPLDDVSLQGLAHFSPDHLKAGTPGGADYFPGNQKLSLRSLTRHRLVRQMSERDGWIDIDHLILTSLGADAFLSYFSGKSFDEIIQKQLDDHNEASAKAKDPDSHLVVWKHRMVLGRDVYFVEVYFGVLFPMVYPTLHVSVTQRKFASRAYGQGAKEIGPPGAFLLQRQYLLVKQPDRQFASAETSLGRGMPVKSAVLGILKTPDLESPNKYDITYDLITSQSEFTKGKDAGTVFIPRVYDPVTKTGKPFLWPITLTDSAGRQVKTSEACLLFSTNVIRGQKAWDLLNDNYRTWNVPPQQLGLAPEEATVPVGRTGRNVSIPFDEREGTAALGEVMQHWRTAMNIMSADDAELKNQFDRFAGQTYSESRDFLSRFASLVPLIEANWKGTPEAGTALVKAMLATYSDAVSNHLTAAVRNASPSLKIPADEILAQSVPDAERLRKQLAEIRPATMAGLADALKQVDGKTESIRAIQDQLTNVAKISSAIEAHKITFGSIITDTYTKRIVRPLIDKVGINPTVTNLQQQFNLIQIDPVVSRPEFQKSLNRIRQDIQMIVEAGDAAVGAYIEQLRRVLQETKNLRAHQFHACLEKVDGIVPSIKAMLPESPVQTFELMPAYLSKGIDQSNGLFARVSKTSDHARGIIDKLNQNPNDAVKNGLCTPRMVIQGLSNRIGAVTAEKTDDLKKLADPGFEQIDLKNAIPKTKLFGVLELADLIGTVAKNEMPSINLIRTPEEWSHTWKWTAPIKTAGHVGPILSFVPNEKQIANGRKLAFHLDILTRTKLPRPEQAAAGERPVGTVRLDGYLGIWDSRADRPEPPPEGTDPDKNSAFALKIIEMVIVSFRQVRITADYLVGETPKPKVKPEIVAVTFDGPLKYLMKLQPYFESLGGGFRIAVLPDFIELSFGFPLPPISFGAFSLRNILLTAGLLLPFGDRPLRFSFGVSSFAVPFEMAVLCFGGRGFLRVEIDTSGGRLLEGALEFGGVFSFDVGVASGGVYVVAGIYFKITESETQLAGYLRAGGNVQVLGLIHITLEFLLMVTYRDTEEGSELYGTCTITVSIELLFFSASVGVTFEKRIAGSKKEKTNSGTTSNVQPKTLAAADREPVQFISFNPARGEEEFVAMAPAEAGDELPLERDRTYFERNDYDPAVPDEDRLKGRYRAGEENRWHQDWTQFDYTG